MIAALVLAAGQSKRMGRPKMTLPWGAETVLGHVIQTFRVAQVEEILVVTGGDREAVEKVAGSWRARTVYNPDYEQRDMLSSIQVGLGAMTANITAALIALGDQPQMQESTVRSIVQKYAETSAPLIVPSYRMRRGHPWLVKRELWDEILAMRTPETPRDFLGRHAQGITYLVVDTPTVLDDIDTPEEYRRAQGTEK